MFNAQTIVLMSSPHSSLSLSFRPDLVPATHVYNIQRNSLVTERTDLAQVFHHPLHQKEVLTCLTVKCGFLPFIRLFLKKKTLYVVKNVCRSFQPLVVDLFFIINQIKSEM